MRRNMAQSLFQYGQIETTWVKAKEIRPFVERLITLAKKGTLQSRQRVIAQLGDRSAIGKDEQERYDEMNLAQRERALRNRSGRRHRTGKIPAHYDKKKFTFVAKSISHVLIEDVAPRFKDRPGGYTRIIRLPKRRIGDNSDLAILQLVGEEEPVAGGAKQAAGKRRRKAGDRARALEGKAPRQKRRLPAKSSAGVTKAESTRQEAPPATGEGEGQ